MIELDGQKKSNGKGAYIYNMKYRKIFNIKVVENII